MKVTIYTKSEFLGNIVAVEAKLLEHGRRKYAQYDSAPFVDFIPKGARKPRRLQGCYRPYILIVEGWGHEAPPSAWNETKTDGVVISKQSKYMTCDDRWLTDFEASLVADLKVVADYRERELAA